MEMTINRLPARTWEHLGMNEAKIEAIAPDRECEPEIRQTEQGTVYRLHYLENGSYENQVQITAEPGSSVSYIIVTDQEPGMSGFSSLRIRAEIGEGASLRLYLVHLLEQSFTALTETKLSLAEQAGAEVVQVILGGRVYAGGYFDLLGAGSSVTARIGYLGTRDSHLDMNYVARHYGKNTTSRMESTGVLRDNAFKLLRGTIDFLRGSRGAVGDETEDVLLIGEDVVNQSIPLILCAEEDVEGNHGASIGQPDEGELFYLASRGIGAKEAERLIARARLESVISRIPSQQIREEALARL